MYAYTFSLVIHEFSSEPMVENIKNLNTTICAHPLLVIEEILTSVVSPLHIEPSLFILCERFTFSFIINE